MKLAHWLSVGVMVSGLVSGSTSANASDITLQLRQRPFGLSSPDRQRLADTTAEIAQARSSDAIRAISTWRSAAEQYRLLNDLEGQQRAYRALSQLYAQQQLPVEAEYALRQTLGFARARRDFSALVQNYNEVGTVLLGRSSSTEAEKSFSEGLRIATDLGDRAGQGLGWTNLGLAAQRRGQDQVAIKRLKTGIAFYQGTSDVVGEAIASNYLGDSYRNLGDAQQSAGAHLNALILARSSGSVGTQDQAMAGLASAYDRAGSTDSARNVLDQRLTLAMSGINTLARVSAFRAMAEFSQRQGDLAATDRYYQKAIAIASSSGLTVEVREMSQKLENLRRGYHLSPLRNGWR